MCFPALDPFSELPMEELREPIISKEKPVFFQIPLVKEV
jgi:hypothetical protein